MNMGFHIQITILTIFWLILSFIQKFKLGLWCTGYVFLVCGGVFLYNGKYKTAGGICVGIGIACFVWLVLIIRKQYDNYKYKK